MHNIEITMEKVVRIVKSFEVPDSVYEEIKRTNRIPDDYFCKMEGMCEDTGEVNHMKMMMKHSLSSPMWNPSPRITESATRKSPSVSPTPPA